MNKFVQILSKPAKQTIWLCILICNKKKSICSSIHLQSTPQTIRLSQTINEALCHSVITQGIRQPTTWATSSYSTYLDFFLNLYSSLNVATKSLSPPQVKRKSWPLHLRLNDLRHIQGNLGKCIGSEREGVSQQVCFTFYCWKRSTSWSRWSCSVKMKWRQMSLGEKMSHRFW